MAQVEDIEAETANVIRGFVEEGHMFTALDVSNEVKNRLPGVRHREIAPIVRDLYASGAFSDEYEQTLIQVLLPNGQTTEAFLYHDSADDPDDYAGNQRRQHAKPPAQVRYVPPGQPVPASMRPQPQSQPQRPASARASQVQSGTGAGSLGASGSKTLRLRVDASGSLRLPKAFIERVITTPKVHLHFGASGRTYLRDEQSAQPDAVLEYDGSELDVPKHALPASTVPGQAISASIVGFVIELA
ncbi:MAG: hypothetical protein H6729_00330 [Deltaproteobacteria bacterium]|nr:hypothetical protein [Deltaproteobacteria bacterium]